MQNFVIIQRSSLVYLAEAMVGTGLLALLVPGVSCSKKSPRAFESLCPNASMAGRFHKSKSLMLSRHCCRAGFGIV